MKKIRKLKPKNLFWGKWSHAVNVRSPLLGFREIKKSFAKKNWDQSEYLGSIDKFITEKLSPNVDDDRLEMRKAGQILKADAEMFKRVCDTLIAYEKKYGQIEKGRAEWCSFSFYSNDTNLADMMIAAVPEAVKSVMKPIDEAHEQLMRDHVTESGFYKKYKTIRKLPDDKWVFKVKVSDASELLDEHPNVGGLLLSYHDQGICKLTGSLENSLRGNTNLPAWCSVSIYVADEDTLTMLTMVLGKPHIKSIEEYLVYKA